ncbi:hypothetical protein DFQ30_008917 [Apophysomyces sp. BC1015]|nr:hypothetical protein DFQ30_008917 [Apophysomyces sp. BC1015]
MSYINSDYANRHHSIFNNRKEQGADSVEIARLDASIGKTDSDRCKLFLESKCVIDRLVQVTGDCNVIVCGLQLAGK